MKQDPTCLAAGDETIINQLFEKGGQGTRVSLCQGSIFRLQRASITFTAPSQELYTEGYPDGRHRAMLVVEGANLTTAIKGDCIACDGVAIRNLIVDGNRPALLRVKMGTALIELGNAGNQVVQGCRLYDTRSWSTLHLREGDRLQCSGALVEDNDIGPCGEEWDESYDGTSYGISPRWGQPWADGISLACKNSIVRRNVIHDATDGAIVIFGSAGSRVHNNTIYSKTLRVTGGINLVDYPPWEGDYTGVVVEDNIIDAIGAFVSVGIAIGPATWTSDIDSIVRGATVRNNVLRGPNFGYGIVVSSVTNFTVMGNVVDVAASEFSGTYGSRCPDVPLNAPPKPFLVHRGTSDGVFQEDFEHGEVLYIVCIEPPFLPGSGPAPPRRLRDSPDYSAFKASEENPTLLTTETRISDALMSSQVRVMRQLDELAAKVQGPLLDDEQSMIIDNPNGALLFRFDNMEHGQKQVRERLRGLKSRLDELAPKLSTISSHSAETAHFSLDEWSPWLLAALLGVLLITAWCFRWRGRYGAMLARGPQ